MTAKNSPSKSVVYPPLLLAPAQVLRGDRILSESIPAIAALGQRPVIVCGQQTFNFVQTDLIPLLKKAKLSPDSATYSPDCSKLSLSNLGKSVKNHQADLVIGVGGGKALDSAKLLAKNCQLPVVTLPTSAATCAAWTALANVYSPEGAFQYDVSLDRCPDLLILDYALIQTAPVRTLVAGIGDAIAKWYEASVSSGQSSATLTIAAVQQARVLRDLLFQKSAAAIAQPGQGEWQEVVDATVLLAGVIGGLGGVNCRTVAAHAVHNGLTQIPSVQGTLHGEKVAYGILVQLRLEELVQGNQLAITARHQLLDFYATLGLPTSLEQIGLGALALSQLRHAAEVTCLPQSDIHRLPFSVSVEQVMAAMVSTNDRGAIAKSLCPQPSEPH